MNRVQKVDQIFSSSFDKLVENIFQRPVIGREPGLPLSTIGDYIDVYRDKKVLERRIELLKSQLYELTDELQQIEYKELELKRSERSLLEEKKSLKTACENKSLFLANMSHEIRTPMNGVIGSLELLKQTELTSDQRQYLGIIETCAQTLLAVVDDVLDYSKIEANELKIESVDFNLKEIVSQVRDILIFKAQEKGIEFTTHIVHNVPFWLKGDPLRIRQVLLNLASNAIKFTRHGTVAIEVSLQQSEGESLVVVFKVKDTGIGIKNEQKALLFQCYSQVNPEITRQFGGTGLGLAISKKLTDLMKGTIGVESQEGVGSEFWFSIPLVKQQGTKRHKSDLFQLHRIRQNRAKKLQRDLSILLVEDDAINQKITSILLEKEGYQVTVAENGMKALELLTKQRFDLILMDVEMPGWNGYETTRKVRQLNANICDINVPIIAMTAHAMTGDREKCLVAGMNDYISKPINLPVLNEIIDRLCLRKSKQTTEAQEQQVIHIQQECIQLDKLCILREEVEDRFDMLVELFLKGIPEKLVLIRDSIQHKRFEDLRIYAHQLKGSCSAFYAQRMVEICQQLEQLAVQSDREPETIKILFHELEHEAEQVASCLQKHFQ